MNEIVDTLVSVLTLENVMCWLCCYLFTKGLDWFSEKMSTLTKKEKPQPRRKQNGKSKRNRK